MQNLMLRLTSNRPLSKSNKSKDVSSTSVKHKRC